MIFQNFELLIKQIEKDLGKEFNQKFREARKKLAFLTNFPNQILFSEFDKDKSEWVYNRGGKKEIQYHIYLRNGELGYGLGFNSQRGSFNNDDPVEIANSFGNCFKELYSKIIKILPSYKFTIGSEEQLGKMEVEEFLLFGNSIPYNNDNALDDLHYQSLITDLKKQFEVYLMIFELNNLKKETRLLNEKQMEEIEKCIDLLKYKKQIILQGPPGTGKTKLGKEIVDGIINKEITKEITEEYFKNILVIGFEFYFKNKKSAKISKIAGEKIVLDIRNNYEEVFFTLQEIVDCYKSKDFKEKDFVGYNKYTVRSIVSFVINKLKLSKVENQFKLIQFHPSYTYEDFVRGIVAESKVEKIEYKNVNKTLGLFAEKALKNYVDSKKEVSTISKEKWLDDNFNQFVEKIAEDLNNDKYFKLTDNVNIVDLEDNAFLYIGNTWKGYEHRMLFKDIKQAFLDGNSIRKDLSHNINISGSARQHATYYVLVLQAFLDFVKDKPLKENNEDTVTEKSFVLIIDEINRANLSSVLGELIYALEYRGKEVESMYEVDGSQKLILPPNLYIIGTMNTADRSVGHIDYAIRRRFAFVNVLPEDLTNQMKQGQFFTDLFLEVKALFTTDDYKTKSTYISHEFEAKDVALGHSYFIDKTHEGGNKKTRWQYEIKPILLEYLRDGVLKETASQKIEEIEEIIANI